MPSPRQVFDENMRPAELLVCIHALLEHDRIHTEGGIIEEVRKQLGYDTAEALILIRNHLFLGVIREAARTEARADPTHFKQARLENLLRQAIVASCSALETYLYALLETNLITVVRTRGRDFLPDDRELMEFLSTVPFNIKDALRILAEPGGAPLFIANKSLLQVQKKYVKGTSGVHGVGTLLGLEQPWERIAEELNRDEDDLKRIVKDVTDRRNDIVHRADRPEKEPNGPIQAINREMVRLWVETVGSICRTLDRLVETRLAELKAAALVGSTAPAEEGF
jgi:hypothetical protein